MKLPFFSLIVTDLSDQKHLTGKPNMYISLRLLVLVCDSSTVVESIYQFEKSVLTCCSSHSLAFPKLLKKAVLNISLLTVSKPGFSGLNSEPLSVWTNLSCQRDFRKVPWTCLVLITLIKTVYSEHGWKEKAACVFSWCMLWFIRASLFFLQHIDVWLWVKIPNCL